MGLVLGLDFASTIHLFSFLVYTYYHKSCEFTDGLICRYFSIIIEHSKKLQKGI